MRLSPENERRLDRLMVRLFDPLERIGLHLRRAHFYEPIPQLRELPADIFERHGELPGVDMRVEAQLELLDELRPYIAECADLPWEARGGATPTYYQRNLQFERVDAEIHHALIRHHRPRRIIEIGCGFSTLIALRAIAMNRDDDPTYECELTCIDPYPRDFLGGLEGISELIAQPVQDVPLERFAELEDGDFLFVDSSHVVKIGSDAQYEFMELIPRVAPGVHVQVHDIFFPTDYPEGFVREWHRFFNEQYVLQAFLAYNESFEVTWCGSQMAHLHRELVSERFPSFDRGGQWPSSFWMRRTR